MVETDGNESSNTNVPVKPVIPQILFVPGVRRTSTFGIKKRGGRSPSYRVISSSGEYGDRGKTTTKRGRSKSPSSNKKKNNSRTQSPSRLLGGKVEVANHSAPGSRRSRSSSPKGKRKSGTGKAKKNKSSSPSRSPSPSRKSKSNAVRSSSPSKKQKKTKK